MKPIIFSGRSCPDLGMQIAKINYFSQGESEIVTFANSEIRVRILSEVTERNVYVVQSTSNPTNDNLMELLLLIDALGRQQAREITVIIPYFGYARQNLQHQPGECVSLNVVVKMLESLKVDKVITLDIHDEASSGIFSIPFTNLSALPELARQMSQYFKVNKQTEADYVIGSPDQGGVERARVFADHFYSTSGKETVVVEKKRNLAKIHESMAIEVLGNVKDKHLILVDDVATSGKTIINAAKLCLEQGARSVSAAVVHPDFAAGVANQIEKSSLSNLFTTNSIEKTRERLLEYHKITVIEIAPIFRFKPQP